MQNNEILKPAKYFSELEKSVLLALVEKYKYVLECKKSDARTIALKQRTWQALAYEYNSQPSVSLRDFKQLKKCWENIKARTKKIMAHERREKVKWSVGPAMNSHESLKERVASMIPEQIYFLQNPPDEDSEFKQETSNQDPDCKKNVLDLELFIDEKGKIQTKSFRRSPASNSVLFDGNSPPRSLIKESLVSDRELCDEDKEITNLPVCEGTSQPEPSCSAARTTGNKNYRSKAAQEAVVKKMHEEEHQQQMSILQLQLIQMNEVHVAKMQQIERECEMAEEQHRIKMEVLNKKKMYWERKLQTITKEWPVSSFNRPFPSSP
ncbi:myb/SANT-like DNA-binding domain-containing protein 3 [Microcaecilia unicolor]|uniref:Myb/SANT-like DNA-binding domain-containing protein 3 n=1 Tax=Microcaecilia unicolor TaxID=1415580 RepID=A0A6P7X057_9AMPH|nr:myb/SANT-like DNA-binding domain-containing protein 3 [Microcaecilia unicolor]XP_030061111.1 myb/SANT-like DNA-binding domain-containing protein 3 [Microcaecilia unicolor]